MLSHRRCLAVIGIALFFSVLEACSFRDTDTALPLMVRRFFTRRSLRTLIIVILREISRSSSTALGTRIQVPSRPSGLGSSKHTLHADWRS